MTFAPRHPVSSDITTPRLAMPDQNLNAPFHDPQAPGLRSSKSTLFVRALVILVPVLVTVILGALFFGWFALDGRLSVSEGALVVVTSFAFFWVVMSACTALAGLFWRPQPKAQPTRNLKIAILLPMYGEPAEQTIGNAVRLLGDLHRQGMHSFALHILSDTQMSVAAGLERLAVSVNHKRQPNLQIFYRRRAKNIDYKSGNIRDWVQTDGHAYDAMLVLDADSLMGPLTVLQMADAMAAEPGLGLIQTVPRVLPGHTLWQGLQSFASDVYGVNMGRGFAMWAGVDGNFLGHNALVRVRAFAAAAGLPHLPGAAPRGGVILSHDFVEAALLRRAGWGVRMMPEAEDSFEDTPETLMGYLKRDKRWCQGNLQHLRLLLAPGLHPLSRFHLLQGAMAYLASVWWLVLLILWAVPKGGAATPPLFSAAIPTPNLPPLTQASLAGFVALMLVTPKIVGLISYMRRRGVSLVRVPRFAGLVLAEVVLSALLAPALMVQQVRAVLRTAWGLDGGWMPHVTGRSDLRTLLRFHALETGLGAALLILALVGHLSLWLVPIAISLCLAVPLAALVQMPRSILDFRPIRQGIV